MKDFHPYDTGLPQQVLALALEWGDRGSWVRPWSAAWGQREVFPPKSLQKVDYAVSLICGELYWDFRQGAKMPQLEQGLELWLRLPRGLLPIAPAHLLPRHRDLIGGKAACGSLPEEREGGH